MRQIAGIGRDDGALGEEAARRRLSRPGLARWSIPAMPYISPAALGLRVVRPRGEPSQSKRAPMARRTLSGEPRPLDALMLSTSPSRMSAAACAGVMSLFTLRSLAIQSAK